MYVPDSWLQIDPDLSVSNVNVFENCVKNFIVSIGAYIMEYSFFFRLGHSQNAFASTVV